MIDSIENISSEGAGGSAGNARDLLCLSHLRWDFVYQRPQHLLSRAAREGRRVFFFEEPFFGADQPRLEIGAREDGVTVAQPHLPHGLLSGESEDAQRRLLDEFIAREGIVDFVLWYYTPMARGFSAHLSPAVTVYDCMDELSMFKGAPPELKQRESELLDGAANLVFTGGQSIFEAKREQTGDSDRVHCFPSSIDFGHFARARETQDDPADQAPIAHPRLGFFGVVDERFDIELLRDLAAAKPEWQFVIIGPVVKIDETVLPRGANIHYLGGKSYQELPGYIAGWDIALLLFARNDATRFISPTKTPEYLAAARPVISTSIRDVIRPYGDQKLVEIADDAAGMIAASEKFLDTSFDKTEWLGRVDGFLAGTSWDETWRRMSELIGAAAQETRSAYAASALPVSAGTNEASF